jgi:hypothetical protein
MGLCNNYVVLAILLANITYITLVTLVLYSFSYFSINQ